MNPAWIKVLALVCTFGAVVIAVELVVRWVSGSRAAGRAINLRLTMIGRGRTSSERLNLLRRPESSIPTGLPPLLDRAARQFERMLLQAEVMVPTGRLMLLIL